MVVIVVFGRWADVGRCVDTGGCAPEFDGFMASGFNGEGSNPDNGFRITLFG